MASPTIPCDLCHWPNECSASSVCRKPKFTPFKRDAKVSENEALKRRVAELEELLREALPFIGYSIHVPEVKQRIEDALRAAGDREAG